MKSYKHVPPSKLIYEKTHPVVSVRVTQKTYDELRLLEDTTGKSFGDILREALGKQKQSIKQTYQLGYDDAKEQFGITYLCKICHAPIIVQHENVKKAIIKFLEEQGWGHASCHEKNQSK